MTIKKKQYPRGIILRADDVGVDGIEGELKVGLTSKKFQVYLDGALRDIVSENQVQTLTNKTINADANTVSNLEVDNLKAGVLKTDTTLTGATNTEIPSALAVKTYSDTATSAVDTSLQNHINDTVDAHDASAISNVPVGNLLATDVQGALNELQGDIDTNTSNISTTTTNLSNHINDTVDAHDASAISTTAITGVAGGLASDVQSVAADLKTQIDTKASNTDLTTHTGATSAHGTTGAIVGTTDTQTLTNKTLTGAVINTPSKLDVKQDTKTNLQTYATTASNGQLVFATDDKKMYQIVDNALQDVGGGAGGINYITNPDFENGIDGYATYADAAAVTPTDGTGGIPNVTLFASVTNPLRGTQSGFFSKDAVSRQGEGFSTPFQIAKADQTKMVKISFDYETSVNYVDGDMRVYILPLDGSNLNLIELNDRDLYANANGTYTSFFQATADALDYRLIFHIASTSALAYDLKIDNVVVSPQGSVVKGAVVTDWKEYVPIWTTTTGVPSVGNGTLKGKWRRVGGNLELQIYLQAGSTTTFGTSDFRFSIPEGLQVDLDKLSGSPIRSQAMGVARFLDNSTGLNYVGTTLNTVSDPVVLFVSGEGGRPNWSGTVPVTWGSDDHFTLEASMPIAGWSSNVVMSEDAGNRRAVLRGAGNAGTGVTTGTTDIPFISVEDTVSGWNGTQYTIQETGDYDIEASVLYTTNGSRYLSLYVNGASDKPISGVSTSTNFVKGGLRGYFNKGQVLSIRSQGTDGTGTLSNNSSFHYISIAKRSNPQTIAASETVAMTAGNSSGQSIPHNVTTVITGWTKTNDTHNSFNTTTGEYTVPVSGIYLINTLLTYNNAAWALGNIIDLHIFLDGTLVNVPRVTTSGVTSIYSITQSHTLKVNKGQVITVSTFHTRGASTLLLSDNTRTTLSITRVGN